MVKKKNSKKLKELNHKARKNSIKEGIFSSAKSAFGDNYIAPFAIAINTSSSMVALLGSISGLLGPISQTLNSRLIEKKSRKKIILRTIFLETLMWIPFILIAILFYKGILTNLLPIFLLLTFSIYIIIANRAHPAWFSWMGDIVKEENRGTWFSKRNLILGFVSLVLAITASFFLDYFKKNNLIMFGFIILFSLAIILEIFRYRSFKKQYEPKIKLKKGYYFSYKDFIKNSLNNNFGRFTIYRGFVSFSAWIYSSLIAVYLLRYLEFSYSTYMLIIMSGVASSLIILELWGKIADKYGNYQVLAITSMIIPFIPILWILNNSPLYLILVPQLISGSVYAGFHLASGNFIYDNVNSQKRGLAVSYFNLTVGIGVFFGAGIGAFLIKFLTISIIEPIIFIFILSSITSIIVVSLGLTKLKEIRKMKKLRNIKSLEHMIIKEAKPTILEEFHEITHIKKYFKG
tara:strand:- start:306 stop:1688 length:1383 start_codon:yes stop_codon:yes gene_type:complete